MAKSVTIYGIKHCDTMKKARAWGEKHGVAYSFHDYKTVGSSATGSSGARNPTGKLCSAATARRSQAAGQGQNRPQRQESHRVDTRSAISML